MPCRHQTAHLGRCPGTSQHHKRMSGEQYRPFLIPFHEIPTCACLTLIRLISCQILGAGQHYPLHHVIVPASQTSQHMLKHQRYTKTNRQKNASLDCSQVTAAAVIVLINSSQLSDFTYKPILTSTKELLPCLCCPGDF